MNQPKYEDGQIVNGHRFDSASNQWVPLPVNEPAPIAPKKKQPFWKFFVGGGVVQLLLALMTNLQNGGKFASNSFGVTSGLLDAAFQFVFGGVIFGGIAYGVYRLATRTPKAQL